MIIWLPGSKALPQEVDAASPARGGAAPDAPAARASGTVPGDSGTAPAEASGSARAVALAGGSSEETNPLAEEVALLHAAGDDAPALAALETAFRRGGTQPGDELLWAMALDLHQALDQREAFEARALEFVRRFEKSPPAWVARQGITRRLLRANVPLVTLSGTLGAATARQMLQIERIAARHARIRVDMGLVEGVEEDGCELLMEVLGGLRDGGRQVSLLNAAPLADLLQHRVAQGRQGHPVWLLLLELLQHLGEQARFEEMAVRYAVQYEVSPPSWRPEPDLAQERSAAAADAVPGVAQAGAPAARPDVYAMRGIVRGNASRLFDGLARFAATRAEITLDLTEMRRMDFAAASALQGVLEDMAARGRSVCIIGASSLVAVLLALVGVGQVARIERRR